MPATYFGPDDEDAFYAYRDALVERFEKSTHDEMFGWVASAVLDFKWSYLDGDLAHWTVADIHEILFEIYPRKVMLDPGDEPHVVRGFAALLSFLAAEQILASPLAALVEAVEAAEPEFTAAMSDPAKWGMSKGLLGEAQAQGVDLSDPAQLEAYVARHNSLPIDERRRITGDLPTPQSETPLWGPGPLPAAALPPEQELRELAGASVWVRRVRDFCTFVGKGRALTSTGNLRRADAVELVGLLGTDDELEHTWGGKTTRFQSSSELRELDHVFHLALAMQYVNIMGSRLVPGAAAADLHGEDDLLVWERIVQGLLGVAGTTSHRWGDTDGRFGAHAPLVDGMLLPTLIAIYVREVRDLEIAIGDLIETIAMAVEGTLAMDGYSPGFIAQGRRGVRRDSLVALHELQVAGALVLETALPDKDTYGDELDQQMAAAFEGTATLTPLGRWLVQRAAEGAGYAVAGALAGETAAGLLRALADLSADDVKAEMDAWILAHPDAAALLVEALPTAGETERSIAFRALLSLGAPAQGAVESLAADPELSTFATVWRVDAGLATPEEVAVADSDELVRLLGTVLDLWGPQSLPHWSALAAGSQPLVGLVDQAWRSDLPVAGEVLTALGSGHTDKAVAKAARKAAFKWRSRTSG